MLQKERLKSIFIELLRMSSPAGKERALAFYLSSILEDIGLSVGFDSANKVTGGDTGNLIAHLEGDENLPPLMLNAHLDTVESTEDLVPIVEDDIIRSDGNSVLGADDKSGIACIIETLRVITDEGLPHPPIDIVFTVCEETGLLGAKNLDYSRIRAKMGYAVDSESPSAVVIGAPYHNKIVIDVHGRESHAGVSPSNGINAIKVASDAISKIELGQIDRETTANIGVIRGGTATNIVPGSVELKAEVRSHNKNKLEGKTKEIVSKFEESALIFQKEIDGKIVIPEVRYDIRREYDAFRIKEGEGLVKRVFDAGSSVGIDIKPCVGGGGSDASIFNEKGIKTVILGTGMKNVHTKEEYISLEDMVRCTELLISLLEGQKV
ncbi:M20/M25/M40 family metallo-hydrolase [candidate division WOR-3 bacterium]|nr:M20/M25/M40 family metallo-hydrolase [candidate division WOR-3 bacterium]